MKMIEKQIRAKAKELLAAKTVDCVIGYCRGTLPMQARPFFAHTPEDAEQLIWSAFCTGNLAKFLINRPGKTAVVAQGCVSRNIVGLIQEQQVQREDVYILGVSCPGMADAAKVRAQLPERIIKNAALDGDELIVEGEDFSERRSHQSVKRDNCRTCTHRNAVLYDIFIGDKGPDTGGADSDAAAAAGDALPPDQRWEAFTGAFQDCLRCYACRNVCPLCYCQTCFVDEHDPQWCGKGQDETDIGTFHLLRALHCAGRCTECGACESACPVGIKTRVLTSRMELAVREKFGCSPGLDIDVLPPLSDYRSNDPEINQ